MNTANICHLSGTVQGECWTCWRPGANARGQVRFNLAVSKEIPGDGFDVFLCAVEPADAGELRQLENELAPGRKVAISARAQITQSTPSTPNSVLFVAKACDFDGGVPASLTPAPRRPHAHGKLAAAADEEPALFSMSEVHT